MRSIILSSTIMDGDVHGPLFGKSLCHQQSLFSSRHRRWHPRMSHHSSDFVTVDTHWGVVPNFSGGAFFDRCTPSRRRPDFCYWQLDVTWNAQPLAQVASAAVPSLATMPVSRRASRHDDYQFRSVVRLPLNMAGVSRELHRDLGRGQAHVPANDPRSGTCFRGQKGPWSADHFVQLI